MGAAGDGRGGHGHARGWAEVPITGLKRLASIFTCGQNRKRALSDLSIFYVTLPAVWLVLVEHNKARQAGS